MVSQRGRARREEGRRAAYFIAPRNPVRIASKMLSHLARVRWPEAHC